jgi:hypothetical protein
MALRVDLVHRFAVAAVVAQVDQEWLDHPPEMVAQVYRRLLLAHLSPGAVAAEAAHKAVRQEQGLMAGEMEATPLRALAAMGQPTMAVAVAAAAPLLEQTALAAMVAQVSSSSNTPTPTQSATQAAA